MAPTKADGTKKAGGKASNKMPVLRPSSNSKGRSGGSVQKPRKSSGGSYSVREHPTPIRQVPLDGFFYEGKAGTSSAAGAPPPEKQQYEVVDLEAEETSSVELDEGELSEESEMSSQESEGEGPLTSPVPAAGAPPPEKQQYEVVDLEPEETSSVELDEGELSEDSEMSSQESEGEGPLTLPVPAAGAPPPEKQQYEVVDLEAEETGPVELKEGAMSHQEREGEGPLISPVPELVDNPVAVVLNQKSKTDKDNEEMESDAEEKILGIDVRW